MWKIFPLSMSAKIYRGGVSSQAFAAFTKDLKNDKE